MKSVWTTSLPVSAQCCACGIFIHFSLYIFQGHAPTELYRYADPTVILPGNKRSTVQPGYNDIGLSDTSFLTSDTVLPINSSLLTITSYSSLIATLVCNKILSPFHDVLTEFYCIQQSYRYNGKQSVAGKVSGDANCMFRRRMYEFSKNLRAN
jgi:hypothetical protein